MWTNRFGAPFFVIDHLKLVNMLAWIAVPEGVFAILLPPLTLKRVKT